MTKPITRDLIEDALRASDPEPYDGEHEHLYYRSYAEQVIAWLDAQDAGAEGPRLEHETTVTDSWKEFGYRIEGHEDVWATAHGGDGEWSPDMPKLGVPSIDLTFTRPEDAPSVIYATLREAGVSGVVLVRTVSRGEPSEIVEIAL